MARPCWSRTYTRHGCVAARGPQEAEHEGEGQGPPAEAPRSPAARHPAATEAPASPPPPSDLPPPTEPAGASTGRAVPGAQGPHSCKPVSAASRRLGPHPSAGGQGPDAPGAAREVLLAELPRSVPAVVMEPGAAPSLVREGDSRD
jgi:hypothetical protein